MFKLAGFTREILNSNMLDNIEWLKAEHHRPEIIRGHGYQATPLDVGHRPGRNLFPVSGKVTFAKVIVYPFTTIAHIPSKIYDLLYGVCVFFVICSIFFRF